MDLYDDDLASGSGGSPSKKEWEEDTGEFVKESILAEVIFRASLHSQGQFQPRMESIILEFLMLFINMHSFLALVTRLTAFTSAQSLDINDDVICTGDWSANPSLIFY